MAIRLAASPFGVSVPVRGPRSGSPRIDLWPQSRSDAPVRQSDETAGEPIKQFPGRGVFVDTSPERQLQDTALYCLACGLRGVGF